MGYLEWLLKPWAETEQEKDKVATLDPSFLSNEEILALVETGELEEQVPEAKEKTATKVVKAESVTKSTIFRPLTLDQYIGQKSSKKIIQQFITGTRQRGLVFPHTLIHGGAGCGKTTLVKIIANLLKVPFIETITSDIVDFASLRQFIDDAEGGILFLDEIHGIERSNAEKLYSIMEDFSYNGELVPQFTLIGATTELGEILKTRRPFYDRFKIIIGLEEYTAKDLTKIGAQYKVNLFPEDELPEDIYHTIAKNSRLTPRTVIRLLEASVYFNGDIDSVLESYNIIKDGYTKTDLKLLEYMYKGQTVVGVQSIASYLGTSEANYTFSIEPYLLKTGMLIRTPRGRKITEEGAKLIQELGEQDD